MAFRTFGTQLLRQVAKTTVATPVAARNTAACFRSNMPAVVPRTPVLRSELSNASPKSFTSLPVELEEGYSKALRWSHWLVAGTFGSTIGFVKAAQWTEDKAAKGNYMMLHKSTALLSIACIAPRVLFRLTSNMPSHLPGNALEHLAASLSHYAAYGAMLFLPASGVAMGYYGGKGIPFYDLYTIPGASKENRDGKFAGQCFKYHKLVGQATEYLIPIHIGAAVLHTLRGHAIFARINPLQS